MQDHTDGCLETRAAKRSSGLGRIGRGLNFFDVSVDDEFEDTVEEDWTSSHDNEDESLVSSILEAVELLLSSILVAFVSVSSGSAGLDKFASLETCRRNQNVQFSLELYLYKHRKSIRIHVLAYLMRKFEFHLVCHSILFDQESSDQNSNNKRIRSL